MSKRLARVEDAFLDLPDSLRAVEVFDALAEVGGVGEKDAEESKVRRMVVPKRRSKRDRGDEE